MEKIKRIPYGVGDFELIQLENDYYIDKTQYIPLIEISRFQFLIRPRRFGKTLFLSMLHSYYDINKKDDFEKLFHDTWILNNPTDEKNKYMILTFNFSAVNPDIEEVENSFNEYCNIRINQFLETYNHYLEEKLISEVRTKAKAGEKLKLLSSGLQGKDIKIYIMIDEYDNFANTIISRYGQIEYQKLTHSEGFFRYFFNVLKEMTSGSGAVLSRLFITGVSPITMDDVTSGFNIGINITTDSQLNSILGFEKEEVINLIDYYSERGVFKLDKNDTFQIMDEWYGNYVFSENNLSKMYNSDMVLYYMTKSYNSNFGPDKLIDKNVRIDYKKLEHFLTINRRLNGNFDVLERIITENGITGNLIDSFPLKEITKRDNFISLLFYFGLITMAGNYRGAIKFKIPNKTIKDLVFGFIRDGYKSVYDFNVDVHKLSNFVADMAYVGEYKNAFEFIAKEIERIVVLRDFIDGERVIQAYFMSLFSITNNYILEHEKEQNLGFSDMVFKPFYSRYPDCQFAYLVEFKYIPKKDYNEETEEQFVEIARKQLNKYEKDEKFKKELKLKPYGNKQLIKLIVIFSEGEMKLLQEVV